MISISFVIANILFVAENALVLALPRSPKIQTIVPMLVVGALIEIIFLIKHFLTQKRSASHIVSVVY